MFVSIVLKGACSGWASLAFAAAFCIYLTVRACQSAMAAPGLRSNLMSMELSMLTLILFTAYCGVSTLPAVWCIPAVGGCAAAVVGVMLSRLERSPGLRGWLLILAAFILIFFLLWLLVSFAAAPAGGGVVTLWQTAVSAVRYVLDLIWRFLLFLVSLIPQTEIEGYEMEFNAIPLPEQHELTDSDGVILGAMAFIAAVFLLIGLVRLLIRLGRVRVGGKAGRQANGKSRRHIPLSQGLRRLWAALQGGIALRLRLWREKNMPAGLLCILIRRCRFGPWHKRTGETPREFLLRLQNAAGEDRELREALTRLIPAVDAAIYAENMAVPFPEAALIRRRVGSAVRRQFLSSSAQRLRQRLRPASE